MRMPFLGFTQSTVVFTSTVSLLAQLIQLRIRSQSHLQSEAFELLQTGHKKSKGFS